MAANSIDNDVLEISILLWNVWNLPSWLTDNKSKTRALQISPLLNHYDVVVLNEAFVNHSALLSAVTHEHHYIPARPWFCIFSSGLIFLSKHKIIQSGYEPFTTRTGVDRFAAKGIAHILVDVERGDRKYGPVRIFGSHMQASYGPSAQHARMSQSFQIGALVRRLAEKQNTQLLVARRTDQSNSDAIRTVLVGDMNIGPANNGGESYSQHYHDIEDARGRTEAYAVLKDVSKLCDVVKYQDIHRDQDEYQNEICRILISDDLSTRHAMSYELQPYTDGGKRLSDTKALCVRLILRPCI